MGSGHLGGNARHLKSRQPFVLAAQQLISSSDDNNRSAVLWADHRWDAEMLESATRPVLSSPSHPPGIALPRTAWVRFSRLRADVGRFRSNLYKWGAADSELVSVARNIKPLTMLSSNVQSIDLPMDCTT